MTILVSSEKKEETQAFREFHSTPEKEKKGKKQKTKEEGRKEGEKYEDQEEEEVKWLRTGKRRSNFVNVTLAIHGVELFPVRGLASPGGTVGSPGRTLSPDVATDDSRSSLSSSASPRTVSPSHNMLDFSTNPNPTLPSPSMLSFLNLNMESAARNSSSGLVLGSPPLAALHTMTEMKTQALLHPQSSNYGSSGNHLGSPGSGKASPTSSAGSSGGGGSHNPHGIDNILSRPAPVTASSLPRAFNMAAAAAGMAAASYFHHHSAAAAAANKHHHLTAELTSRGSIYWPGLPALVSNPIAWRERISNILV
ncbi:hypothetical protein RUM43_007618 [Polyplax serrata]|uniref:Uncharacterized protein n=1 Tax=Polyplax serrata TaxID=468196 RepID=A0AAN8SA78_POLSC